jgi:long-chain acyl-CoA synthetase
MKIERVWLKSYPPGIPEEIGPLEFGSVADMIEKSCQKFSDQTSFVNFGSSITYAELEALSRDFAAWLQANLPAGSTVAVMMPNLLQYPVVVTGILRAGMVVSNINPLYTARELHHQLNDAEAKAIVVLENTAHTLEQVLPETGVEQVITTTIGDMLGTLKGAAMNFVIKNIKKMVPAFQLPQAKKFKQVMKEGASLPYSRPDISLDDTAFLQYTGGTTGVSKGAVLTHRNLVANVQQVKTWLKNVLTEGADEVVITALPLYHIFALMANFLMFSQFGAKNILITNPRDMKGFVKELGKHKFTLMTGVNTLFNGLLNTPGFADLDFSRFRFALGGGMAVQRATAEKWKEVTGVTLVEAYGLTETSPAACINPVPLKEYNGTIGLPIPSTDCIILDDNENPLPIGEAGELCIRGPQVMKGYYKRPEETKKTFTRDGEFLKTGDVAVMDENGFFKIVDRKKDMILVSGFNVYPNEIEDAACLHEDIIEAAAIGVPDAKSGEVVKLFVVSKNPDLTEKDVRAHCKLHLTGYKVPRHVEFREELPKSNVGKILRKDLRGQ